jgi:integrase
MATLRLTLAWACKKGWIDDNPVAHLQQLKTVGQRRRFLTTAQIEHLEKNERQKREHKRFRLLDQQDIDQLIALAQKRDPDLVPLLVTVAYTGMRRGELVRLTWSDIDLQHNILIARSAKQSRRYAETIREIPIHPRLRQILLTYQQKFSSRSWIFGKDRPFSVHQLTYYFRKLVRNTPFEGIGLHAFRHAFSSRLADAGVDQRVINALMGHTTEQISRRYRHLFPERKNQAVAALK